MSSSAAFSFRRFHKNAFAAIAAGAVPITLNALLFAMVFTHAASNVEAASQSQPATPAVGSVRSQTEPLPSVQVQPAKLGTDLFPSTQPQFHSFQWRQPAATSVQNGAVDQSATSPPNQLPLSPEASGIQLVTFQAESSPAAGVAEAGTVVTPAAAAAASAIDDPDATKAASATTVEAQIKKVDQSAVTDEVKAIANKHNQQAVEFLRLADEANQKAVRLKEEIDGGPALIADLRKRLSEPLEKPEVALPLDAKPADLEALRAADESRLIEANKAVETWETKAKVRAERKPQMPSIIEKTTKQLAETRDQKVVADTVDPLIEEARRTEQAAFTKLLQSQLQLYQIERSRYDALNELFPLQRDSAVRTRIQLEKRSEFWKTAILEAGKRESARQAAEAQQALQDAHPALKELAEKNADLTKQRASLQKFLADTRSDLDEIRKLSTDLQAEFQDAQAKESIVGLTTAIGLLLRNQRSHLPEEAEFRDRRREAELEMTRLQMEQMPLDDERKKLVDQADEAEQLVAAIDSPLVRDRDEIQAMAFALLTDRQKYLDDILKDYDTCTKDLAELDIRCRALIDTSTEYRNYIDARVLWVRSAKAVGLDTPIKAAKGVQDISQGVNGGRILRVAISEVTRSPVTTTLVIMLVLLLLGMQSRLRTWISVTGAVGVSRSGPGIAASLVALTLTVIIASVWPAILWGVGIRLTQLGASEFLTASGLALRTTALVFWTVEIFRQMCRVNGIAHQHLLWPVDTVRSLHVRLVALLVTGLPFVYAVKFTEQWKDGAWADSLGRLIFVAGMIVLSVNLRRIVRPNGPALRSVLLKNSTGWAYRTRYVWSSVIVFTPILLAGLTLSGFQYTAEQLLVRVEATAWLFILLVVGFTLAMRWMQVAHRRMSLAHARERRQAAVAAAASGERSNEVPATVEQSRVDFSRVSEQMFKLTRIVACVLFLVGAWGVWGEVVPALQVFDRVELWSTVTEVAEDVEIAEGKTRTMMVSRPSPVTLGSALLAIGSFGLFLVASRNLPGLLQLTVLQHLPMDDGGRHAITTLCRYALFATGMMLSAKMIGIGWSSVQWLLAALTVGLGFGLQEIFANFVSGLIILFERPVRIGDVVTIDNVSGKVSRIQIRATTITDFDRKEYIVPNKEFVTGRVLNWTLSDKTNRIVINVGVGYGHDTMLARGLLVKVAKENPVVLNDPEPIATFEGFGDSCLTLRLRCFLPSLDDRLKVITELHESIDREFRTQGLEIAFPQRDIHIRSMTALPAALPNAAEAQVVDAERKAA